MKHSRLLPLIFLVPTVLADEAAMKKALALWEQEMVEFRAAQEFAKTPEQKANLSIPDGMEVARPLWKAISTKTGEREAPGKKDHTKVATYEFEESWALPGVVWFIQHPDAFAKLFADKPRQQSFFAEALLHSVYRVHYRNPAIAPACAKLAEGTNGKVYDILERIYTHNPDSTARANAALGLCIMLSNPLVSGSKGLANTRTRRVYYLRQALTLAPENAMFGSLPFADVAQEVTYSLQHLTVGGVPEQAKVLGMDGKMHAFPQAGNPHLLYFWDPADAEGAAAVRHMLDVQERYPDLVICPIVPHQENADWADRMRQAGIDTCYMDDEQASTGMAFRLAQLPFTMLVNDRCRILHAGAPGMQLQTAIDSLNNPPRQENAARKPENKGRVIIGGQDDDPAPRPGTKPGTDSEPPALRDMPEF